MEQRINFITLGVSSLQIMKDFYQERFGWEILKDMESIVFFKLNGLILGLFPADELANDIGIVNDGEGFRRFTLAVNFSSEAAVDLAFDELRRKGVKIVKEPAKVFWGGYSGYVSDPEENYWELAFNPFLEMDAQGNSTGHQ